MAVVQEQEARDALEDGGHELSLPCQGPFGLLAGTDILDRAVEQQRAPAAVPLDRGRQNRVEGGPVLAHELGFDADRAVRLQDRLQKLKPGGRVGVDGLDIGVVRTHELILVDVAEHAGQGRVPLQQGPFEGRAENAYRGVVENGPVPLFALAQLVHLPFDGPPHAQKGPPQRGELGILHVGRGNVVRPLDVGTDQRVQGVERTAEIAPQQTRGQKILHADNEQGDASPGQADARHGPDPVRFVQTQTDMPDDLPFVEHVDFAENEQLSAAVIREPRLSLPVAQFEQPHGGVHGRCLGHGHGAVLVQGPERRLKGFGQKIDGALGLLLHLHPDPPAQEKEHHGRDDQYDARAEDAQGQGQAVGQGRLRNGRRHVWLRSGRDACHARGRPRLKGDTAAATSVYRKNLSFSRKTSSRSSRPAAMQCLGNQELDTAHEDAAQKPADFQARCMCSKCIISPSPH
ncbi:hypothetical protein DSECCO2_439410 [anaerobic digester metagenome]